MNSRRETILVVDDDHNDQLLIVACLQQTGATCPIHTVNDGAEGLAYLKGEGAYGDRSRYAYPSMIITDLKMPRLDGLGLLEFLRGRPEQAVVPTIVFTASADPDDVRHAYALGASAYHVKPTEAGAFLEQLRCLRHYWSTCETPAVDLRGRWRGTDSDGKIGERYSRPDEDDETGCVPI